jgi:protein-disulfide isomerase/uncharacterized membrane protein
MRRPGLIRANIASLRTNPAFSYLVGTGVTWLGASLCVFLLVHRGEQFCSSGGSCESVLAGRFATLFGIYLPYYGLAFYSVCFVLIQLAAISSKSTTCRTLKWAARVLAIAALAFSGYLLSLQIFVIRAFCLYCLASSILCIFLFASLVFASWNWDSLRLAASLVLVLVPAAAFGGWLVGNHPTADPAIYTIDGTAFHRSSLTPGLDLELQPFNDAIYEVSRRYIEQKIRDELVSMEVRKAGLNEESYLKMVKGYALKVSEEEIAGVFAPGSTPVHGSRLWQDAERFLFNKKFASIRESLGQELKAKHAIKILLEQPRRATINMDYRYVITEGPASAPVHLVVLSDFECPYCATLAGEMRRMRTRFRDQLQIGFWNLPLPIHEHARTAAIGSLCAAKQDHFWQYHDLIFSLPKLTQGNIPAVASQLSLDLPAFNACLLDPNTAAFVEKSVEAARAFGVDSTPSLFLNGQLIGGVPPEDQLAEKIQAALKSQKR